ncbi:MAG: hypothetical protein WCI02_13960 [Planctomycetota bacterium]
MMTCFKRIAAPSFGDILPFGGSVSFGYPYVVDACLAWAPYTGELVAGESTPSGQSSWFRKRMASVSDVPAIAVPQEFRLQIADATQRLQEQSSLLRALAPARDKGGTGIVKSIGGTHGGLFSSEAAIGRKSLIS